MKLLPLVLILATTGGALAEAPGTSLRPVARTLAEPAAEDTAPDTPAVGEPVEAQPVPGGIGRSLRPRIRTSGVRALAAASAEAEAATPAQPEAARPAPTSAPAPAEEPGGETLLDLLRPLAQGSTPKPAPEVATRAKPAPKPEDLGVKREVPKKSNTLLALLRPKVRTKNVEDNAKRVGASRRGKMICGVEAIQGIAVGAVAGKGACGIDNAVRVSSVAGVGLSTHALMDCTTAKALNAWVAQAARPAIGTLGGGLSELRVAAHYACRTRNNQRGAKISEHGKGHAIDISGFKLRNGQELTVLRNWNGDHAKVLRAMHKAACGPFGTVLGPRADRFHQDHFHLDTARYRAGTYCR